MRRGVSFTHPLLCHVSLHSLPWTCQRTRDPGKPVNLCGDSIPIAFKFGCAHNLNIVLLYDVVRSTLDLLYDIGQTCNVTLSRLREDDTYGRAFAPWKPTLVGWRPPRALRHTGA
jgi:hypothetical protein